jgi:hypothetical protein
MKTAMQELIELLSNSIKFEYRNELVDALKKEKEQIIDAYMIAAINNTDKEKWHSLDKEYFEICANEYFKKHFNQN